MKKKVMAVVVLGFFALGLTQTFSQQPANPRGEAVLSGGKVRIEYGRPSTKGRDVMGMISPGTYWRMGADTSTTLKTEAELLFGTQTVPKGDYTLLAHYLEKDSWELIVCKGVQSGSRPKDTVAVVPLSLSREDTEVEQMTIDLNKDGKQVTFLLSWGSYRLAAEFSEASTD